MMVIYPRNGYTLFLSDDPSELFRYFDVDEMFGLNIHDCLAHENTKYSSYIAGLCNLSPINHEPFVFINLKRCWREKETATLVFHEMLHLSKDINGSLLDDVNEEQVISWAEEETMEVIKIIEDDKGTFSDRFLQGMVWGFIVGAVAGILIGVIISGYTN
jgi:hypothetical protein